MAGMTQALLVGALLAAMAGASGAQEPKRDVAYYVAQAAAAHKAKDYAGFLDAMLRAHELLPDHARVMYNLACAYALNRQPDKAVAWLDRIAAAGLAYPAAEDEDLASLKGSAAFQAVLTRFAANLAPVRRAETAFAIRERGFIAEGIAHDPVDGAFYVSSVRKRKVVRVDRRGIATDFASGREGLWAAFGLRVDAKRRLLWVTTAAIPQMVGFRPEDAGRAGVLKLDLATGRLLGAYVLPGAPEKHNVADLAIDSRGDVYVTDSETPAVYVVRAGANALERLAIAAPFASPQGIAFSADEKRFYVADYGRGIFVVDRATLAWRELAHADGVYLFGIDGLCLAGGNLYATQNGTRPRRVVRIALDAAGTRAERLDVLEANTPGLGEPTLGAVVDGWFYFNADSQWDRFDDKNDLPPDAEMRDHPVMRVKL
jgi:sugar lactone lactonase YvrE